MPEDKLEPEVLFLRYAVPCAMPLVINGKITAEERDELERAAIEGRKLDRARLERIYPQAILRMARYYPGEDIWDFVGQYFREIHNKIIAGLDKPELHKDRCMVHEAEVVDFEGDLAVVKYQGSKLLSGEYQGERTRKVKKIFVPDVKIGNKVTIHWNYAVEILEKNKN